jgi:tetratricopeptide (TPR) repeat protein
MRSARSREIGWPGLKPCEGPDSLLSTKSSFSRRTLGGLVVVALTFLASSASAADLAAARKDFLAGRYEACIKSTAKAIADKEYGEAWPVLKARAELFTGRPEDANATIKAGLERYGWSVQLRLLGHHVAEALDDLDRAETLLKEIEESARRAPWRYTDADDLLAIGEAVMILGADPRMVLENFFDRARAQFPDKREPHIAVGMLALEKQDFELAAEIFQAAVKKFPDDAEVHFGLAKAFAPSEPLRAAAELQKCLAANPRFVPALLLHIDRCIDGEQYDEADRWLLKVSETNPHEPDAWAFRAILAHLRNDPRGERLFRDAGSAASNPEIDHLIGLKLSQKYRFAEGAAAQRRALAIDPEFIPAKVQLAQDLLRLGDEEAGWEMAKEAGEADGYNVSNFNLLELKDRIAKFTTLEDDHFIIRMETKEAAVYGRRVQSLLGRAKQTLCEKYGLDLQQKIVVEIFPDENDFAVRTFGMPAGSGYLGVCFGKVITANSPASQKEHPANWESVLWHEFCHVVTLELTLNKMPRWLSEGISVYEEAQENPSWGQRMNPRFKEMILAGELTPVSQLSSAFLNARDGVALQFAYYESNLVVEFLVREHGLDCVKHVLRDLKAGLPINDALERHTDGLPALEAKFAEYARDVATKYAANVDNAKPELAEAATKEAPKGIQTVRAIKDDFTREGLEQWLTEHPNSAVGLTLYSQMLLEDGQYELAKKPLRKLIELNPGQMGPGNAYENLAGVHRMLKEYHDERLVLETSTAIDCSALGACQRLIELGNDEHDPEAVMTSARKALAINPMLPKVHRAALDAGETIGATDEAIESARALLVLSPDDASQTHYRLARLLHSKGDAEAKTHVLQSLEEAPRFRAAQKFLLEIRTK